MTSFLRRNTTILVLAMFWGGLASSYAAAQQPSVRNDSPRSVTLLDAGWQLYPMPDFQAWPSEQELTPEQIRQLKPPAEGAGWLPVHLPDDYVVRGRFSEQPNQSLLASGAVCDRGGRQCEVPTGPSKGGDPKAYTRARRSAYGGHG